MMNEIIKMNENLVTEIEINHFISFDNFKTNGFKRVNLLKERTMSEKRRIGKRVGHKNFILIAIMSFSLIKF